MESRWQEWLRQSPPTTLFFVVLCVTLHILLNLLDWNLRWFTLCPRLVTTALQFYRIGTSALFHANVMHIGMNMMSMMAIGGSVLEKRLGSLRLLLVICLSICVTGLLHIGMALLLQVVFRYTNAMNQHSVGFSGVLFHLSVLECNNPNSSFGGGTTRSVFGFFQVPSAAYPWVLLVVLQLFMPGLSFLGHLSGILAGTFQVQGRLRCLLPTEGALQRVEEWRMLQKLTQLPSFCPTTSDDGAPNTLGGGGITGIFQSARRVVGIRCDQLRVYVFGRGSEANANIVLWGDDSAGTPALSSSSAYGPAEPEEDDDDGDDRASGSALPIEREMV